MRILIGMTVATAALLAQELALNGLDPVALAGGRELTGSAERVIERGGYAYRFGTDETHAAFRSNPERYEIQLNGACARMGAASGVGTPSRWTVHDGRIYIFASDQCRNGFLSNPDGHLARPESAPEISQSSAREARKWLDKAAGAHGLKAGVKTYTESWGQDVADGRVTRTFSWKNPGEVSLLVDYPKFGVYGDRVTDSVGVYLDRGKEVAHRPMQYTTTRQQLWRHPLLLLAARSDSGFKAWMEADGDSKLAIVGVFHAGGLSRIGIDRATGRVASLSFAGPGPKMVRGLIEERYSDYRMASGVLVPFVRESSFEGTAWPQRRRQLELAKAD